MYEHWKTPNKFTVTYLESFSVSLTSVIFLALSMGCAGTKSFVDVALEGDTVALETLIAEGADVNAKAENNMTALMNLSFESQPSLATVNILIAAGADLETRSAGAATPLMMFALREHVAIVNRLIAAGANVNAIASWGSYTALMLAAGAKNHELVEILIAAGADVNARTDIGATSLMVAVWLGSKTTIRNLIAAGADVNARTDGGATAMMMTGPSINISTVQILLEAGAEGDKIEMSRIAWMPYSTANIAQLMVFLIEDVVGIKELFQDNPAKAGMDVRAVYECVEYKKARERPGSLPTWTNECFDQMVELHPGAKSDYRTRGRVSHDRGNYDEALVDYASAIEQNPYDYHSYLFRGYTLAAMGDHRGAIADFTDTIRLNPKSYHAFSHRANAYEKLGMHEEAEADRERSKQLK